MDPTLANNQRVIVLKHTSIERFDIVVAKEVENGKNETNRKTCHWDAR